MNRDFKGIWIPKEIYLDDNLNWTEKILLIEIDSLDNEEGCYASNEYFADFLGKSKRHIRRSLKTLKENCYIRQENFDGRKRILRSNLKYVLSERTQMSGGGGHRCPEGKSGSSQASHSRKDGKKGSINTFNNLKIEEEDARTNGKNIPAKIKAKYEEIFQRKLTAEMYEKILKLYSDVNIIMKALQVAEENGDKPSYLLKLLSDWQDNGLTSISSINTYLEDRQANNGNQGQYKRYIQSRSLEEMKKDGWR